MLILSCYACDRPLDSLSFYIFSLLLGYYNGSETLDVHPAMTFLNFIARVKKWMQSFTKAKVKTEALLLIKDK